MEHRSRLLITTLVLLLVPAHPSAAVHAGEVVIEGTTSFMRDRDDHNQPLKEVEYHPLEGTNVRVFRIRGVTIRRATSDAKGGFGLAASSGRPLTVVFVHSDVAREFVPEIQQLCGEAGLKNTVH